MITNVPRPHLPRSAIVSWLLTDYVLAKTTPKAADTVLAEMHSLAEFHGNFRRRHPVRDDKMAL